MLIPRSMYSPRSVDSRGFFCFSMMVGYPIEARKITDSAHVITRFVESLKKFYFWTILPGLGSKRNGPHGNAVYPLVVSIGAKCTQNFLHGIGTGSEDF